MKSSARRLLESEKKSMPSETSAENADNQANSKALFSIADCANLDASVRKGRPSLFAPLEEQMEFFLQAKLNSYSELYKEQAKLWNAESDLDLRTSFLKKDHAEKTKHKAVDLLKSFGLNADSVAADLDLVHYSPRGIFEDDYVNTDELIPLHASELIGALSALIKRCDRIIADEEADPSKTRIGSENLQLLLARLALLYAHVWGGREIRTSVNMFGEGGPSIRFMQEAASKIVGRALPASKIKHAYKRSGERPFAHDKELTARDIAQL